MTRLCVLRAGATIREAIACDRVIEGAPVAETRLDYECDGKVFVGEWSCSVGAWRVAYDEWEYCTVLEGACELVADGGEAARLHAGDQFVIEPGFTGVWRVLAPMKKRFVIHSP